MKGLSIYQRSWPSTAPWGSFQNNWVFLQVTFCTVDWLKCPSVSDVSGFVGSCPISDQSDHSSTTQACLKSLSSRYLEMWMDGSCDVASLRVSWVVDVFDHRVDVHTPSFENPPWWERARLQHRVPITLSVLDRNLQSVTPELKLWTQSSISCTPRFMAV